MPTGQDIAGSAQAYAGIPYKWAGHLPSTGWDCSGFVGYVLGNNFGMTLPGGIKYSASSHGPVAAAYKVYGSGVNSPQAGDLCVWVTHVGIALTSSTMISALSPAYGTAVTPIQGYGPPGEPLTYRRVSTGAGQPTTSSTTSSTTSVTVGSGCIPGMLLMPILIPAMWIRRRHAEHELRALAEAAGRD